MKGGDYEIQKFTYCINIIFDNDCSYKHPQCTAKCG